MASAIVDLTIRNSWAHKRRLVGTLLAVVLGVSFLSGTLVLGDTLRSNFDELFSQAYDGTAVVVAPKEGEASSEDDSGFSARVLDASLADTIRDVPGVRAVAAEVSAFGQLLSTDGERVGGEGPPTLAGNWIADEGLNPYQLAEGRAPVGPDEVVINRGAAIDAGLSVGDTATVLTPAPVTVDVVGISTFGDQDGSGPVTFTAFSDEGTAAHLQRTPGTASQILVAAEDGVAQDELSDRVADAIDASNIDVDVLTGDEAVAQSNDEIAADFLGFLTTFLVMFAAIALLVATFSIYNTFSILVAQRTRESALLRAIGASRRQILGGTMLEALVIGIVASVIGLVGGIGVAAGLKAMFDAFGFGLPAGGLTFTVTSVIVAFVVGVVVTVVAALGPARRAGKVAPVEALRESAAEAASVTRRRVISGVVVTVAGIAALLGGVLVDSDAQLGIAGLGAVVTLIGMIILGPVAARPIGRLVGAPMARVGGIPGELARDNATRNPRRTASTAAALMVGVAVVVLFSVMIASAANFVSKSVDRNFGGDLVVSSGGFGPGTLPPSLAEDAAGLPGVSSAVGVGVGGIEVDGEGDDVAFTDPDALGGLLALDVQEGSLSAVGTGGVAMGEDRARELGLQIGDTVDVGFPDGAREDLRLEATYANTDMFGNNIVDRSTWAEHAPMNADVVVFVGAEEGASIADIRSGLSDLTVDLGRPEISDREEYTDSVAEQLNALLGIITVMLALAIIIALMGIANTLALSVHERSREIGLLRAVGTTRRQLRRIIRWESVIISAFGTMGGIGLGLVLGWSLVTVAFADSSVPAFAIPFGQLLITVAVGVVAGVLAAARPARRAAKREVLDAIAIA